MLWTKCDTLISNSSGNPLNCKNCPCGYYALFAFKRFPVNRQTGEADFCRPGVWVEPFEVINNKINGGDYCRRCYEINRTPDEDGLVGYSKGCFCCWEDCWDWQENPETGEWYCAEMGEYCDDCSEVWVYRLSPCFNKYEDFAAWFYSGCGIEPDEQDKYPAIWEWYYGYLGISGSASTCISNHWQSVAEEKYLVFCKIEYKQGNFSIASASYAGPHIATRCGQIRYECWNDCPNGDCEFDEDWNCVSCADGSEPIRNCYAMDCEKYEYDAFFMFQITDSGDEPIWGSPVGGYSTWEHFWGDYWGWMYHPPKCCEVWSKVYASLASVNAYIDARREDRESYYKWMEENSVTDIPTGGWDNNWCMGRSYSSTVGAWSYADPHYQIFRTRKTAEFTIRQAERTDPNAIGVKIQLYLDRKRGDNNMVIEKGPALEVIHNDEELDIMFDTVFELPFADNLKSLEICNEAPDCDDDCNWGSEIRYCPSYMEGPDQTIEEYGLRIKVMGYVYA